MHVKSTTAIAVIRSEQRGRIDGWMEDLGLGCTWQGFALKVKQTYKIPLTCLPTLLFSQTDRPKGMQPFVCGWTDSMLIVLACQTRFWYKRKITTTNIKETARKRNSCSLAICQKCVNNVDRLRTIADPLKIKRKRVQIDYTCIYDIQILINSLLNLLTCCLNANSTWFSRKCFSTSHLQANFSHSLHFKMFQFGQRSKCWPTSNHNISNLKMSIGCQLNFCSVWWEFYFEIYEKNYL